jgi:hypothetical protein
MAATGHDLMAADTNISVHLVGKGCYDLTYYTADVRRR